MKDPTAIETRRTARLVVGILAAWGLAVIAGAELGLFAALYMPLIAAIVAVTIIVPTLWYFASPQLRGYADRIGLRPLTLFHLWRIPAALLFFWYGAQGALPPVFWIVAGTGDLMAGIYAVYLISRTESARGYWSFHIFGMADFIVAVGIGLTYTLLQDPRMATIAVLPMALIPLFGVGISGTTHLIAFDMLRRGAGLVGNPSKRTHHRADLASSA